MKKRQNKKQARVIKKKKVTFPKKFPFWARLKIEKNRSTLVIDEAPAFNTKKKRMEDGFVHREATSKPGKGRELLTPNPLGDFEKEMYLKRPKTLPQRLFKPHSKQFAVPKHLRERYEKNNKK